MNLNRRSFFKTIPALILAVTTSHRPKRHKFLTVKQIADIAYPQVTIGLRKTSQQWSESAMLRALEKNGHIQKIAGAPFNIPIWNYIVNANESL